MLYNLKRCYTATIGTGTLTIGAAILNDFSDIPDGTTVSYSIMQGSLSAGFDAEVGRGTYSAGTLARDTVLSSTSGGAKIALDGTAQVVVTALAEDFVSFSGGVAGQVATWSSTDTITAGALIPPASNVLTLTNAAASTLALNITAAKTLTLTAVDNFALTIPESMTVAGRNVANTFTAAQFIDGTANSIQFRVQGHSTQTSSILTVENSSGVVVSGADKRGILFSHSGLEPNNLFMGVDTGNILCTGLYNVGLGSATLSANITGIQNMAIGFSALTANTNSYNVAIGAYSMISNVGGNGNVAIGDNSLRTNVSGTTNVAIGRSAGYGVTGSANILLGYQAGRQQGGNSNRLVIDNVLRASSAAEVDNAFLYGVMTDAGYLRVNVSTTTNNAILETHKIHAYVSTASGGGAAGFGAAYSLYAETATDGTSQLQARIASSWVDAINSTRKAKLILSAYDTAIRTGLEIEASGTAAKIGFFGGTTAVQQVLAAYTSDGEGAAYTGIDNAQAGTVYATVADLNQLRVAYETLRASYDDLRTKLLTSTLVA